MTARRHGDSLPRCGGWVRRVGGSIPFTVGIAQHIAELPVYSGYEYRIVILGSEHRLDDHVVIASMREDQEKPRGQGRSSHCTSPREQAQPQEGENSG